jgi:hypothetical protein
LEQQLVVHGQLADLSPQPGDLLVAIIDRSALQSGLAACQEIVTPAGEGGGGDAEFAGEKFQVFSSEKSEDGGGLALGREAAALAGIPGVGHGCGLLGLDANDVATGCPTEFRSGGREASRGQFRKGFAGSVPFSGVSKQVVSVYLILRRMN